MEPITLCGAVILVFGLWVEFEPVLVTAGRNIRASEWFKNNFARTPAIRPNRDVYVRKYA